MIEENGQRRGCQLSKLGEIPKTMFQRTLYTTGPKTEDFALGSKVLKRTLTTRFVPGVN